MSDKEQTGLLSFEQIMSNKKKRKTSNKEQTATENEKEEVTKKDVEKKNSTKEVTKTKDKIKETKKIIEKEHSEDDLSVFLSGKKRIDETHETASFNIRKDLLRELDYFAKISERVYFKREFVNYALENALNKLKEDSGIIPEVDEEE